MQQFGRKILSAQELLKKIYAMISNQAVWLDDYIDLDEETLEKLRPELVKLLKLCTEMKNELIKIDQKVSD